MLVANMRSRVSAFAKIVSSASNCKTVGKVLKPNVAAYSMSSPCSAHSMAFGIPDSMREKPLASRFTGSLSDQDMMDEVDKMQQGMDETDKMQQAMENASERMPLGDDMPFYQDNAEFERVESAFDVDDSGTKASADRLAPPHNLPPTAEEEAAAINESLFLEEDLDEELENLDLEDDQ